MPPDNFWTSRVWVEILLRIRWRVKFKWGKGKGFENLKWYTMRQNKDVFHVFNYFTSRFPWWNPLLVGIDHGQCLTLLAILLDVLYIFLGERKVWVWRSTQAMNLASLATPVRPLRYNATIRRKFHIVSEVTARVKAASPPGLYI